MEEGRNIPLIIMLSAGSIISIACIIYDFSLFHTLLFVLGTMVGFYLIGLIVQKIVISINRDAEQRASLLAQEQFETEQKERAESEEVNAQDVHTQGIHTQDMDTPDTEDRLTLE